MCSFKNCKNSEIWPFLSHDFYPTAFEKKVLSYSTFRQNGQCEKGSRCSDRHTRGDCYFYIRGICRNKGSTPCNKGKHDRGKFRTISSPIDRKRKRVSSSGSESFIEDLVEKKVNERLKNIQLSPPVQRSYKKSYDQMPPRMTHHSDPQDERWDRQQSYQRHASTGNSRTWNQRGDR